MEVIIDGRIPALLGLLESYHERRCSRATILVIEAA